MVSSLTDIGLQWWGGGAVAAAAAAAGGGGGIAFVRVQDGIHIHARNRVMKAAAAVLGTIESLVVVLKLLW